MFNVEGLFSYLLVVKGETPRSSLVVSSYLQDTASLTYYVKNISSNISVRPASHKFTIEMRDIFDITDSKCASLPLAGS